MMIWKLNDIKSTANHSLLITAIISIGVDVFNDDHTQNKEASIDRSGTDDLV